MNIKRRKALSIIITAVLFVVVALFFRFIFSNVILSFESPEDAVCKIERLKDKDNVIIHQYDNVALALYDDNNNTTTNMFLYKNELGWHTGSALPIYNKFAGEYGGILCSKFKGKYIIMYMSSSKENISDTVGSEFENYAFGPKVDGDYCYTASLILDELPKDYTIYINDEAVKIK